MARFDGIWRHSGCHRPYRHIAAAAAGPSSGAGRIRTQMGRHRQRSFGALFAVIAFEYFASPELQHSPVTGFTFLGLRIFIIGAVSFLLGKLIERGFHRGYVPEFLKQPIVLIMVLLTYALANILQDEGGLVAVTVLGITLANSELPNLEEMRRFKEYLSLLLVSLVFILITATLNWHDLGQLDGRAVLFILVLLLIVRPLTVMFSTFRSGMTRQELLFVGWIAPRGVVCAAVSGLFGPQLVEMGYADGAKMVPLAFGIVFATVLGPWVYDSALGQEAGPYFGPGQRAAAGGGEFL